MDDPSITKKMIFAFNPNYTLKQKQLNKYKTGLGAFDREGYEVDEALKVSREKLGDVINKRQQTPETLVTRESAIGILSTPVKPPVIPTALNSLIRSDPIPIASTKKNDRIQGIRNGVRKRTPFKKDRTWSNWAQGRNIPLQPSPQVAADTAKKTRFEQDLSKSIDTQQPDAVEDNNNSNIQQAEQQAQASSQQTGGRRGTRKIRRSHSSKNTTKKTKGKRR